MKKINRLGIALILIILILTLVKDVTALGISPGRQTMDFEPNSEKEITLTVFNTEHKDLTAAIFVRGELGDYMQLQETQLKFSSGDSEKSFNYKIKLPEKMDKPGQHYAEIVIREISDAKEGNDIVIGALVAVVSQLEVKVPYPGKYATANLDVVNAKPNEEVKFFVRVNNLGEENIENAIGKITIFNKKNKEVAEINTNNLYVKSKDRIELAATWIANASLGDYKAVAVVNYDNLETTTESNFAIGDFLLKPLDISAKNFKLGQIVKFNILVENLANRELKGASAQLLLFGGNENQVMDIKNTPIEIDASSRKELIAYWDTENVKEGNYVGKIILSYEGKTAERQIRTVVKETEIKTEIIGITAFAVDVPEAESNPDKGYILTIIIIILVLSNIGWLIYYKKFRKK